MEHRVPSLNKFKWMILLFLFVRCSLPGHQDVEKNILVNAGELKTVNGIIYQGEILFTGLTYNLYPGEKDTAEILSYKNGKEDGVWKKFYTDGKLKEQREFSDGKKTGELSRWSEHGIKQMEYFFMNDEYEGTCREWNEAGLLVKEMNYKKGHEEGQQRWWYDNGKIKSNYIIANNRRYGLLGTKNCINVSDSIFKN